MLSECRSRMQTSLAGDTPSLSTSTATEYGMDEEDMGEKRVLGKRVRGITVIMLRCYAYHAKTLVVIFYVPVIEVLED